MKIKQDKEWQERIWKNANPTQCWRLKATHAFWEFGWVTRKKEPCVDCERPTCARKGKKLSEMHTYDRKRIYFLNLIEDNSYVHTNYGI